MRRALVVVAALLAGCSADRPIERTPAGSFSFAVFGDGPYEFGEGPKFRRVVDEVNRSDVEWMIHVGDIFWFPCSDDAFAERKRALDSMAHAVIYTPGDNEWTDCHGKKQGRYDPLERLTALRRVFFADPRRSLGKQPLALESQAADTAFAEFVENARWSRGGFLFATINVPGSDNGYEKFRGRTTAHDSAAARRNRAAIAWLDAAFAKARHDSAKGVVLALHANIGLESRRDDYVAFVERLRSHAAAFPGQVILIHGDTHKIRIDHPLADSAGRTLRNFTRIETFGSPKIGWLRVVVDTAAGRITRVESRLMNSWY